MDATKPGPALAVVGATEFHRSAGPGGVGVVHSGLFPNTSCDLASGVTENDKDKRWYLCPIKTYLCPIKTDTNT